MSDPVSTPGVGSERSAPPAPPAVVRFGVFELDVRTRELRKRGVKVSLSAQPFQVLRLLLERHGDVVTRDELRQRLWSTDTFVNFDLSLNSAVRKLREALGDSAEQPTFIETLPRQGYRFIAPMDRRRAVEVMPSGKESRHQARRLLWALVVLVAAGGGFTIWIARGASGGSHTPGLPPIRSIAVLPLGNVTGDPARDYFVEEMTDALRSELTQLGRVAVVSRTSSIHYKETTKRLPDIARELNVDAILEGTATMSEGKVRINVRLVHAAIDRPVWAQAYEREAKDVLALHAEVARALIKAIQNGGDRTPLAPASPRQAVDPVAYNLYLKGIEVAGRANVEGFRLAISYFDQAITRQPDYAKAHGGLALTWAQFVFGGPLAPNEVLPKAEEAAHKALALDPTVEEAHRALSITRRVYGDREGAAAPLSPSSPEWLILHHRFEEAVIAAQRNHNADPLSVNGLVGLATALRIAGHGTRAVATLQKALDIEPSRANVLFQLGATYVVTGDTKAAIAALEQAVARSTQRNPRYLAYLGYTYALEGRVRESRQILHELLALRERQYVSSFGIALLHDALAEKSAALEALDRAFREHALEFTQQDIYPSFKTLKPEPRYQEIMRLRARY